MNVLAHALVAGPSPPLQVGGVMGDFVRGRPDPALPEALRAGIRLHRAVDAFTDAHPQVVAARRLFDPPWRRYAGVLIDVWFDHLLAQDFRRHAGTDLDAFSRILRGHLRAHDERIPSRMRRFVDYMERHDLPAGYADRAMIGQVLEGLSRRLSRANPLAEALPQLDARDAALARHFEAFFPELDAYAARWRSDHDAPRPGA